MLEGGGEKKDEEDIDTFKKRLEDEEKRLLEEAKRRPSTNELIDRFSSDDKDQRKSAVTNRRVGVRKTEGSAPEEIQELRKDSKRVTLADEPNTTLGYVQSPNRRKMSLGLAGGRKSSKVSESA